MEDYVNQVKNICSQTVHNDKSEFDNVNILLQTIFTSVLDKENFAKYNHDNPTSSHWKLFTVIAIFAKTNNTCLFPNEDISHLKVLNHWCLNRLLQLALIDNVHKISPQLSQTCGAILQFIERHDALTATDLMQYFIQAFTWIVHATEKGVENVDIPWLQYGDKTEIIPIPEIGDTGLNFKKISMRGRENLWSVGSVICELISLLPGMILSNEELAFDDLVRNIKVFVMEGDFYAQTAGLEALNALLYRGGTYMLRCRTASNLQVLANFLLFELRSSHRPMPKMWARRFNKALCSFLSYLSNVEDAECVSLAHQCLCVLLTRSEDEMEQFAALRPHLKALPRFSKHLFHLLLKQLIRCRQRSEEHIEICAQLLFDELSADQEQKTSLFFAFWEEALVLRETIPIEETLTPVFTAALAWSRLLRQKPCTTPTGLFSLLMDWVGEFLNLFHRQQEAGKWSPVQRWCLATYVRTLQAVACVETSVDHADERRNEREEIHSIVGVFVSPFLECLTVQNLFGVAYKPKLKDLLLSVGSHLKREGLTGECIVGLALVTGRTELQLQELVFRRCLQNSSMLESAFRCLPFLAVKIGSDQPNVWKDLLVIGLASIKKRPASVLTLLPHIGRLPCLLTGFLELQYSADKGNAVHALDHLACVVCDGKDEVEDSQSGKALPLELLGDVVDFLLDRESDEQIVIDGVDVLRRILRHIGSDGTPIGPTIKCFHRSLELLQHPSFRVRLVFSEILPDLYRAMLANPKCHELWTRLVKSFQSLLESENAAEVDTAVVTACKLSGICREDHFSQLVPCVMLAGVVRRHGLRGLLWDGIKTIMRTREVSSFQLVAICRSNIAKTLVAFLYRNEGLGQRVTLDTCAATWATFLRIQKMEFFQSIFQDLFLEFVMRCDAVAHRYIQEMMSSASWLEHTEYLDRLCESRVLPETFVALFSRCSDHPSALTPHYNFLTEHCKTHVERIATFNDVTRLIHQLLLRLDGTNNPGLIGGLRWVFTDVLRAGQATNLSYAQLMDLLQSYFYGALVKMDHVLLQEDATAREKLGVLISFSATLKMFNEKAITEHRMKILGTLKIGMTLQGNEVADVIIQAWMNFLKVVDRTALSLMITEVVGCLLNFYHREQQKVAELLRYLIVDNRGQLRAVFKDLHFFPRHIEDLRSCRAILDEEIFSEGRNLSSQLTACFGGLAHESADIRRLMLRTLSETLSENLDELTIDTLVEPDAATIQPIIGKLLGLLLQGCKRDGSANAEMRFLYARCLGAIGPLDPGRLPNDVTALVASERESSPAVGHEAVTACADKYFPFEILSQLCRVHLCSYSPKQQEATAVSIQELLKAYNIDRDSIESITSEETEGNTLNVDSSQSRQVTGVALWQLFDQSVQQMILPLIRAKYVVSAYTDWSKVTRPIFLRPRIDNHSRWVQLWAASMNQYIDSSVNHIFLDCEPVTKTDDSFAQFILPFAFLQVLLDGQSEEVCQLHVEIMAILNSVRVSCQSAGHRARFMRRCPWYRLACQTIFSVLDHCRKWLNQRRSDFIKEFEFGRKEAPDEVLEREDEQYSKVMRFVESIPHEVQATAALGAGFLTRSLRHYEAGLQAAEGEETLVRGLMEAYTSLRELDGAEGVRKALLSKFTPQEVVEHQRMEATEVRLHYQMMRAEAGPELAEKMFQHDVRDPLRLPTLPVTLETLVDQHPTWNGALNKFRVHAAWKLCQWDQLEQSLEQAHHSDWNVGVGRVMLALQRQEPLQFSERLAEAYRQQLDPICASTMQCISYEQVYDNMAKLGALFDIEVMACHALGLNPVANPLSQSSILKVLNKRLEIGRADQVSQDDRLAIRASLLSLVDWPQCRADTSFKRACLARSGGWYNASMAYLAEAERHVPEMEELALQYCRLYWDQGKKDLAMSALEELVKKQGDLEGNGCQAGETLLFYAHCCDMSGRYAYHETKAKYEQALKLLPASEEAHFRLAHYADRTLDRLPVDKARERHELMCFALRQYGEALCYGSEFVYQSMPQMLTRWLDFGDTVAASMLGPPSAERPVVSSSALVQVQKEMQTNINRIPCHRFYSSFAQLVSGVVNECPEVVGLLIDLIVKVTLAFPNQCMWWLVGLHESKIPARKDKCRIIFELLKKKTQRMANYIKDITAMCGFLKELAGMYHKVKNYPRVMSLANQFRSLLRLVERQHFSSIMIPLHRLMSASLPSSTEAASAPSAFPHQLVFLRGFRDRVEILTSLTRPKKVVWKGSDGRDYIMVAKPEDDLRKDSRLMQLNAMINRWLLLNPETRSMIQTSMIRCFAVITLGENGGLIEWVEKTTGYKNMVLELYKEKNINHDWSHLQQIGPHLQDSHEVKLQKFREKIYKLFKPPVFHLWFLRQFPDTNAWFQARSRYTRSAAVMSMVGYIIGLGDRHGENILFDCTNGEVVHCDFNCIFNKGKTYKWPEVVPFRLTHNMLAAFGPTGYEGLFRKCCEAVMKLMREKVDSMLAVFRPAIVDMMLETPSEWFPNERRTEPAIRRKCAFAKLDDVEHRLQGRMTDDAAVNQLPMSAEGQVETLLRQATDERLLCLMYIGWAPFL